MKPLFPFGHGLSYTQFLYTNLDVTKPKGSNPAEALSVDLSVQNIGDKDGAEVVQLYITFPPEAREPKRQLKGFVKTASLKSLAPATAVHFTLSERDLSIWDADAHQWKLVSGVYQVEVGASSADIRVSSRISL